MTERGQQGQPGRGWWHKILGRVRAQEILGRARGNAVATPNQENLENSP